jgi:hypothetical protein
MALVRRSTFAMTPVRRSTGAMTLVRRSAGAMTLVKRSTGAMTDFGSPRTGDASNAVDVVAGEPWVGGSITCRMAVRRLEQTLLECLSARVATDKKYRIFRIALLFALV